MNVNQRIPKLPPEIIVHISTYLNIEDKLKLRLINKEFKMTFDYLIKLNQLTLISTESVLNRNWFYTNRSNKETDLIKFDNINTLNKLFKNECFLNIRLLFFYSLEVINLNKTINQFNNLNELYIECRLESDSTLSLSKLKILRIKQYDTRKYRIQLETPLLSFIRCDNLENYLFNYPEKIIYFDAKLMNEINNYQFKIFRNLEYFILFNHLTIDVLKLISIKFDHLKELHFNDRFRYNEYLIKIKEIYQFKLRSKLNNLRIFVCGIDYEYLKELNEDQLRLNHRLDLIFNNYDKTIDKLPFIEKMYFDKLFRFLNLNPNKSLDNLISKFSNIKRIKAYDLDETKIDCFFQFLSKCNNLNKLKLNLLIDNQLYYLNKLPDLCKRMRYLHLNNLNVNESTDLDFLFKFKKLSTLTLGKLEDLNILRNLSDNLNISINCEFIYKEHSFFINYMNNIYRYQGLEYDSNDLIEYFDFEINHVYSNSDDSDNFIHSQEYHSDLSDLEDI